VNTVELEDSESKIWVWVDVPTKLIDSPSAATAGGRATRAFLTVIVNVTASLMRVCASESSALTVGSEAFCSAEMECAEVNRATMARSVRRATLQCDSVEVPFIVFEDEFEYEKLAGK
jgi:hypothetical protein